MREADLCGTRACVLQRVLQRVGDDDPRNFVVKPQRKTVARKGKDLDEDRTGRQYASLDAETADPDARDGEAALLDDAAHRRAVEAQRKRGPRGG